MGAGKVFIYSITVIKPISVDILALYFLLFEFLVVY